MAEYIFYDHCMQDLQETSDKSPESFYNEPDHGIPNSVAPEQYINYTLAPGEYLVQCPYDKSHRVLPDRMCNHIARCRTNHKNKLQARGLSERYINCPWDEFHIIPEIEGAYHSAQCPNRYKNQKDQMEDIKKFAPKGKVLSPPELANLTEDWGAELPRHLSYNPKNKIKDEPVFYQPTGLSKAAKIKFRDEQRLKFFHLVSGPFWEDYESVFSRSESTKEKSRNFPVPSQYERFPFSAQGPAIFLDKPFKSQRLALDVELPEGNNLVQKKTPPSFTMIVFRDYFSGFLCFWLSYSFTHCQILVPLKSALSECAGIETFEKVTGIELPAVDRIPLYSSTAGAITADCYNRCRSSSSCSAFWIDYTSSSCFRLGNPKFTDSTVVDFSKASSYFERLCLQGDICSKAWVTERIPGYELAGYDDVIIRSVATRKRCSELCLTDRRLPCRSADYWEGRKECRLSREDRRTQPGSFVKSLSGEFVEYIENTCTGPVSSNKGRKCEWEVQHGYEFSIGDFIAKADNLEECQKACENYGAFTCRSVTYDTITSICILSGADMSTTSTKLLKSSEHRIYAQRVPCVDMSLECNGNSMVAKLKTHSPFYGKMYSSTLSIDCETFGHGKLMTSIEYPLNGCGVSKEADGSFVGNLVVQQHPLIQKRGDAAFRLVCFFPENNRTLSQSIAFEKESESRLVEAASAPAPIFGIATSVINSTAKSPSIVLRITDKNGNDVAGVSLGDELHLIIEVEQQSAYGIFARNLLAKSGTNEEELELLDTRGCPKDPAIFPHLKKSGDGSKSLKGRFEAFKFTNDAVVRFQVTLEFCRSECSPIRCDGENSHGRKRRAGDDTEILELQREIIVSGPLDRNPKSPSGHRLSEPSNEMLLCGQKNLIIAAIIGFCVMQILIVLCCAICICQKNREKLLLEPAFRTTSDMYYSRRPSTLFNTLRSIRTTMRD
ncbi:unnamed protein product [Allacma fusca]|uniref:Uncharacterized protein n=1 Tax=Allacma fusca TaxID=39272 RepID=A0A8J2LBI4_9HEXA|nr:unnamed protein product [Allacma fusca]